MPELQTLPSILKAMPVRLQPIFLLYLDHHHWAVPMLGAVPLASPADP